jgi:LysM repeat protein
MRFENHLVQSGQVLSQICARYGVDQADVLRANDLESADKIRAGETLLIPRENGAESVSSKAAVEAYTVRSGDTLSKLAFRTGASVTQLRSWNTLSSTVINIGQKLILSAPNSERGLETQYVVQAADTLSSIALRYGVTVGQVQGWNKLSHRTTIRIGQALKIFMQGSQWSEYTVKNGDNLGKIALKHSCTVKDLRIWNGLSTTFLRPGQQLRIRN